MQTYLKGLYWYFHKTYDHLLRIIHFIEVNTYPLQIPVVQNML